MYLKKLTLYGVSTDTELNLPFVGGINAGFTSPAADYLAGTVDLNKLLIKHPNYTFFAFADGDCLEGAEIANKDLVIVDKSLKPRDGNLAVCFIDGEFTMKRISLKDGVMTLLPDPSLENKDKYKPIVITEENRFIIWGIVTFSIKAQL